MSLLLLFDIDGTLIDSRGAGLGALERGLLDAFDLHDRAESMPALDLAGATDSIVARTLFSAFGIADTPENRRLFYDTYVGHLTLALTEADAEAQPLPGALSLVEGLHTSSEHVLALLTGNVEPGARAKLRHYGLDHFFGFGAFGDEGEHRNELGPIALTRAAKTLNRVFEPTEAVIIGDTPKDIACARAAGMYCIAVATGSVSEEELARHNPDWLLPQLPDLDAFLSLVEGLLQKPVRPMDSPSA